MLFCQIAGRGSIRDISHGLRVLRAICIIWGSPGYRVNPACPISNQHRDIVRYSETMYFVLLDHQMSRHSFARNSLKRFKRIICLMDANIIPLCLETFDWANYRSTKGAVKLHKVIDYDGLLPVFALLTDGKTAEIQAPRTVQFIGGLQQHFGRNLLPMQ